MTTNSFKGKKAIVIGGSSGTGKATAKQLLVGGATVYIVSRDQNSLDANSDELRKYGNVFSVQTYITSAVQVQDFLLKMNNKFGNISHHRVVQIKLTECHKFCLIFRQIFDSPIK
jgi:NAD(P)-dependent dehydrogenase (short-subunit alcohol dehydrogenase family)